MSVDEYEHGVHQSSLEKIPRWRQTLVIVPANYDSVASR
jgi:hypothetical protein